LRGFLKEAREPSSTGMRSNAFRPSKGARMLDSRVVGIVVTADRGKRVGGITKVGAHRPMKVTVLTHLLKSDAFDAWVRVTIR
jgi:hypothetical protein